MTWPIEYKTATEALAVLKSGDRVFIQGSAQTPLFLLKEMAKLAPQIHDVELTFITVMGEY